MPNINAPFDDNFYRAALFVQQGATQFVGPGQINELTGRILVDLAGNVGGVENPTQSSSTVFTVQNIPTFVTVGDNTGNQVLYSGLGYTLTGSSAPYTITLANPLPSNQVIRSVYGTLNNNTTPVPNATIQGQVVIATTGTAVDFPSNSGLVNGITVTANVSNVANVYVGLSGVTNTGGGSGNGYILAPGNSVFLAVVNTNAVYVNGTSADYVSFIGN